MTCAQHKEWSPTRGSLTPSVWRCLWLSQLGAFEVGGCYFTGIQWVEARDAANIPSVCGTDPTTKSFLTQNVSSAKDEKHWAQDSAVKELREGN